jgi:hypothetical protein
MPASHDSKTIFLGTAGHTAGKETATENIFDNKTLREQSKDINGRAIVDHN